MAPFAALEHLLVEWFASLTAATGGSVGGAILLLTLGARLAVLPLNLAVARRAGVRRRRLAALEPETKAMQARLGSDQLALATATRELHQAHGIPSFDPLALVSLLVQAPLGTALIAAVRSGVAAGRRFLWIADLGRPDVALIGIAALLAGLAGALNPEAASTARTAAILVPMLITAVMLSHLSAGLALSWAASNAIGVAQMGLLRRQRVPSHDPRSGRRE